MASNPKPVLPHGAATITREYALTIPEDIRDELVKGYCGELMLFDDYCRMQEQLCADLRAKGGTMSETYWHEFELTKYDDGSVVARKRPDRLVVVDAEDGVQKMAETKIAKFSYAGQAGINSRRSGQYRDEDRLIASDLACEPDVKEVAAWVAEPE